MKTEYSNFGHLIPDGQPMIQGACRGMSASSTNTCVYFKNSTVYNWFYTLMDNVSLFSYERELTFNVKVILNCCLCWNCIVSTLDNITMEYVLDMFWLQEYNKQWSNSYFTSSYLVMLNLLCEFILFELIIMVNFNKGIYLLLNFPNQFYFHKFLLNLICEENELLCIRNNNQNLQQLLKIKVWKYRTS